MPCLSVTSKITQTFAVAKVVISKIASAIVSVLACIGDVSVSQSSGKGSAIAASGKVITSSAEMFLACPTTYVAPLSYYIGTVNATKSTFPSADLTNLTKKSYASGAQKYVATQNCLAILVPPSLDLGALSYTSGGLTTNLEKSDLNLTHDDVEIEGKTYRVYGYRVNGVTEADPLTYDYTIKKI